MNKLRLRALLLLAICPGGALRSAMPLPFTVEDPGQEWKTSIVERTAAPDVTLEAVIVQRDGKSRFAVFRSLQAGDSREALKAFATHLKAVLLTGPCTNLAESDVTEFGYPGHDQQFTLVSDNEPVTCDLFVFSGVKMWWGVLYMAVKGTPAPTPSPFAILRQKTATGRDVVEMAPFVASDTPVTSFPIGLAVTTDPVTHRVAKINVNEVPSGSTTERAGVKVGDEIIRINQRKTQDFSVGLGQHSELGQIFLNRDAGDEVMLEVLSPNETKSRIVVLQIPPPPSLLYRLRR